MISIEFDPADISDDALAELRRLTVHRILNEAPAFGAWLHQWCDAEQLRRQQPPQGYIQVKHELALPPCPLWMNDDLAAALVAVTTLSYVTQDEATGGLVDRWVLTIAEEAAERLRNCK